MSTIGVSVMVDHLLIAVRWVGFVHADDDDDAGGGGERGDGVDGGFDRDQVGDDAGEEGADGEAGVAPQPVDADRAGPPQRVGDVADRGEQGRVDHGGAGAEQGGAERPRPEPGGGGDQRDRRRLDEHAAGDQRFAADPVRQAAGDELAETPDRRVDRGEHADAADREAGVGEEDREQPPGEAVVEVVDEPGLRRRRQRLLPERGEGEDLAGGELVVEGVVGGDVVGGFVAGVVVGLADEQGRDPESEAGVGEAEEERCRAQPVLLGDVAGGERGDRRRRRSRRPR